MARKKPTPYESFRNNMRDAEALLELALAFDNRRSRRMRAELRTKVGKALGYSQKEREELDCLESDDLFVVFLPNGKLSRSDFSDRHPLLRQSVVAACAALETYVADKAMELLGPAMQSETKPNRMRDITLTVGNWLEIEEKYKRKGWGIRGIIEQHLREMSSTSPSQIGIVFSTVNVRNWQRRVDCLRQVERGTTESQLTKLTERRNRIAHTADRDGRGRALLGEQEVQDHLQVVWSIVDATEHLLQEPTELAKEADA